MTRRIEKKDDEEDEERFSSELRLNTPQSRDETALHIKQKT